MSFTMDSSFSKWRHCEVPAVCLFGDGETEAAFSPLYQKKGIFAMFLVIKCYIIQAMNDICTNSSVEFFRI